MLLRLYDVEHYCGDVIMWNLVCFCGIHLCKYMTSYVLLYITYMYHGVSWLNSCMFGHMYHSCVSGYMMLHMRVVHL